MERTRVKELAEKRDETAEAARRKAASRRARPRTSARQEPETALAALHAGAGNGAVASSPAPAPFARANSDDLLALHSVYGNREVSRVAETASAGMFAPDARAGFSSAPFVPSSVEFPAPTADQTLAPTSEEGLREAAKAARREAERTQESREPEHRQAVEVQGGAGGGAAEVEEAEAGADEGAAVEEAGEEVAAEEAGAPVEKDAGGVAPEAATEQLAQQAQTEEEAAEDTGTEELAAEEIAAGEEEGEEGKEEGEEEEAGEGGGGGAAGGVDVGGAVAAMSDAVAPLSAPLGEASAIATGRVSFAPREEERSSEPTVAFEGLQKRAASEAAANAFLSRNASHSLNILALGLSAPPRILAVAEMAKSAIDATAEQNIATTTAHIASVRAQAEAEAAAAVERLSAERDAALEAIPEITSTTKEAVQAAFDEVSETLDTLESDQTTAIENLYDEWDPKFRAVGTEVGDEAVAAAEVRAQAWLEQRNGESDLLDGPIHDNRLEARADAARNVAKEYKKSLEGAADEQTDKLMEGRAEVLKAVTDAATQARESLDGHLTAILDALDASEERAVTQVEETAAGLIDSVGSSLQTTLASLDEQEAAQVTRLREYAERQKGAIDRDAADAVASLLAGAGEAAASFNEALRGLSETVLNTEAPDESALAPLLAEVQAQTDALAASAFQQFEEGIQASEQGIAGGGEQSVTALNELGQSAVEQASAVGSGYSESVATLVEQASSGIKQLQEGHSKTAADVTTAAKEGFEQVKKELEQTFSVLSKNALTNFQSGEKELRAGLRGSLTKLQDDIKTYADKAAAEVQPRWKKALKVLLVVVVIIAVAAITIATGGAGGVLGTILLGAALGAAAGAVIQIGTNLIDGKEWSEGVGKAMVVGAIGGAFGGLGGVLAKGVVNVGLKIAVEVGVDAVGGIVGDLVVGNPITLQGVLIGAGIGAGVGGGLAGLSALKGKIKLKPKVDAPTPTVKPAVDAPTVKPSVDAPTPAVKPAPELPGAVGGKSPDATVPSSKPDVPGPAAAKPDVTPTKPPADAPTTKPPATDQPAAKPADGAGAKPERPHGMEHGDVKHQRDVGGGHEYKVLPNGDIIRCSDKCDLVTSTYRSLIDADDQIKSRLDKIRKDLDSPDPKVKEQAGKDLEAFEGDMQRKLKETPAPPETAPKPDAPKAEPPGATKPTPDPAKPEADAAKAKDPAAEPEAGATKPQPKKGKEVKRLPGEPENGSGKSWDDETMTFEEFVADYRKRFPNSPMVDPDKQLNHLRDRFNAGDRLNPKTGELKYVPRPEPPPADVELPPPGSPAHTKWKNGEIGKGDICFPAGTLIQTPSGARAIESIAHGDLVFSYDFDAARVVSRRVSAVYRNWTQHLYTVETARGQVSATGTHRFWIEGEARWVPASALRPGMDLRLVDGSLLSVEAVEIFAAEEATYNFEVEQHHNYFAGPSGILVHNAEGEVNESAFADTKTKTWIDIYEVTDTETGKQYIGQSDQGIDVRAGQHVTSPKSAVYQYFTDPASPGYIPPGHPLRKSPDFPKNLLSERRVTVQRVTRGYWTPYEAAVNERHEIEKRGGLGGGKLMNKINPIRDEKITKFREYHNPCRPS